MYQDPELSPSKQIVLSGNFAGLSTWHPVSPVFRLVSSIQGLVVQSYTHNLQCLEIPVCVVAESAGPAVDEGPMMKVPFICNGCV